MSLRKPRATDLVLCLLCLMYLITYIDRMSLATAAEPIRNEFKLNNTQLGYAFSAFGYAYLPLQIIGGWIADRFGARKPLTIAGVVWALSTMLTALTTGLAALFGVRLLLGIGEGATFPTATRAMANWTRAGRRGYAQGITHSFARMGNAIAPPLMVALMAALTWRGSFVALEELKHTELAFICHPKHGLIQAKLYELVRTNHVVHSCTASKRSENSSRIIDLRH